MCLLLLSMIVIYDCYLLLLSVIFIFRYLSLSSGENALSKACCTDSIRL